MLSLYRPSPQVPKPSAQGASICFDSATYIINLSKKQMETGVTDNTWISLLSLSTALNTLLWATSYAEVRQAHTREQVDELTNTALDGLDKCAERWPGTAAASQLYAVLSKACLQSYDNPNGKFMAPMFSFSSPSTMTEQASPPNFAAPGQEGQLPYLNPPQFGYVFDSPPEAMNTYTFDPNFPPPQPTFRSNSIFANPATTDSNGRRFSYFPPPDFGDGGPDDANFRTTTTTTAPPPPPQTNMSMPSDQMSNHIPTPPESLGNMATPNTSTLSPPMLAAQTPNLSEASMPLNTGGGAVPSNTSTSSMTPPQQQASTTTADPFSLPQTQPQAPLSQQKPLPTTMPQDWFGPLPPFISPYNMGGLGGAAAGNFFGDAAYGIDGGMGTSEQQQHPQQQQQQQQNQGQPGGGFGYVPAGMRHGSLSQSQQLELMNVLETEGVGDINAFLNAGSDMVVDGGWY